MTARKDMEGGTQLTFGSACQDDGAKTCSDSYCFFYSNLSVVIIVLVPLAWTHSTDRKSRQIHRKTELKGKRDRERERNRWTE